MFAKIDGHFRQKKKMQNTNLLTLRISECLGGIRSPYLPPVLWGLFYEFLICFPNKFNRSSIERINLRSIVIILFFIILFTIDRSQCRATRRDFLGSSPVGLSDSALVLAKLSEPTIFFFFSEIKHFFFQSS